MSGPNYYPDDSSKTFECSCGRAGQLYKRSDGSIVCYSCNQEQTERELTERPKKRGQNLTKELRSKGGKRGESDMSYVASFPRKSLEVESE